MQKWTIKSGESLNIQGESGVISVISIANVTEPDTVPKVKYNLTVDSILIQEGIFNIDSILDLDQFISAATGIASITITDVENAGESIIVLGLD